MSRLVFLLEERSMKVLIEELFPRFWPNARFLCVPHEGKNDLEKSIPRKLRAWRDPDDRFVIVRDSDRDDCRRLKRRLVELCAGAGRPDALVRLACQELEAWYFGDVVALAKAYDDSSLRALAKKERYRDPDALPTPARELERLVPSFQKVLGARALGRLLSRDANQSRSFNVFVDGVERLIRT